MIDLSALGWELATEAPDGSEPAWCPIGAARPVAAALVARGEATLDSFSGVNPPRLDAQTWLYRLRFDAPADARSLVFEGLATLAEVALNGQVVLNSCNMFRRHEIDVHSLLRPQGNELTLRFASLDAALAVRRPRARWRVPMVAHQQLRWFRTTLLGRTPGWSPPVPVVGPWLPIQLATLADTGPRVHRLRSELDGDVGVLDVGVELAPGQRARLTLEGFGQGFDAALSHTPETNLHHALLRIEAVQRWWPHTHGEPALYEATLHVEADAAAPFSLPLGAVGFRRIRIDAGDAGFRLQVNGEPVFCRGGCWTPLDALTLRASPAAYDAALAQARSAGVNMLRLSGAMAYEDDAFFTACDRAGILVWHDLMFANMDYPAEDAGFLAEVDAELAQQLARLQRHPSLAVVCGNSEVEQQAAMSGAPREAWSPPLFHEHIPKRVREVLGESQAYWPSSSHGGDFPFQPAAGTASYYGVGAYQRELDDARHSGLRFATECLAFANIPDDAALQRLNGDSASRTHAPRWKQRVPRDLGAGWDFDDVRDHYVERLYGLRPEALRYADAARHLRLGRAASAEAMAAAFTRWRQPGSACGGALVWFWRDLWAGAGWGVVDEAGHPKAAFHALRRVLQPRHLGLVDGGLNGLFVHLVNESADTLAGELSISLYRHGEMRVGHAVQHVELAPRAGFNRSALSGMEGFADLNWAYRFGPAMADVAVATLSGPETELQAVCFLDAASVRQPADIGLSGRASALADGRMSVWLSTRAAARGVWFEADGWRADDEYFDMAPGAERCVSFTALGGRRRAWRTLVGALNQRDSSTLSELTAIP